MKNDMYERCKKVGQYMVDENKTVRETARHFKMSKSTVHKDLTERLAKVDSELASKVRKVLDTNKAERHIRGGLATQRKYQAQKLQF